MLILQKNLFNVVYNQFNEILGFIFTLLLYSQYQPYLSVIYWHPYSLYSAGRHFIFDHFWWWRFWNDDPLLCAVV